MATPMIQTLTPGVGIITQPEDVVPYILRQVLATPGESTTYFTSIKFSFREMESQYGDRPEILVTRLQEALNTIFINYFSGLSAVKATCDLDLLQDSKYNINIRVTDISGINVITTSKISIDENHKFKIYFEGKEY